MRRRILYLAVAALPTALSMVWYVYETHDVAMMWRSLTQPPWVHDVGWLAIARDGWYLYDNNRNLPGPMANEMLAHWTPVFQLAYLLLLPVALWTRWLPGLSWPMVLFLCIAPGGAAEFLLLPLPWLILEDRWRLYSVGAVLGWLGAIAQWHTGMLLMPWVQDCVVEIPEPQRHGVVAVCMVATVACWLACWWVLPARKSLR